MTATLIRLSTPAEIVSAIPHLIGYTPYDSVAILGLNNRALLLSARISHEDMDPSSMTTVVEAMQRQSVDMVILVSYEPLTFDEAAARYHHDTAMAAFLAAGIGIAASIAVVGDRWYVTTNDGGLESGHVEDADAAPSTLGFVASGSSPAVDRSQVEGSICKPRDEALARAVAKHLEQTSVPPSHAAQPIAAILGLEEPAPTPEDYANAALVATSPLARDEIYRLVAPDLLAAAPGAGYPPMRGYLAAAAEDLTEDDRPILLGRLCEWVRHLPDEGPGRASTVAALATVAAAHWAFGDGMRTNIALSRAFEVAGDDPYPPIMNSIRTCLQHGIRPQDLYPPTTE